MLEQESIILEGSKMTESIKNLLENAKAQEHMSLEVEREVSISFTAEFGEAGFLNVIQDEYPYGSVGFSGVMKALGCELGKRYEFEICAEEC